MKSAYKKVIVSNYQENNLFFSIVISSLTRKIVRISLPKQDENEALKVIFEEYPDYEISDKYVDLVKKIAKIYAGEKTDFSLNTLDLDRNESFNKTRQSSIKPSFMKKVLMETSKISYGEVETYKSLAEKLGSHAYRAVGTTLKKNPYPLIIPCHRVVRSDLTIGQYAGGSEMKKELLKKEGVPIKGDKVLK